MNEPEAKILVIDILAGIAPEADFVGLRGHAGQSDKLDLDSMDFLNFITLCTNVPDQYLRGRLAKVDHVERRCCVTAAITT